jgi:hypothetical protein
MRHEKMLISGIPVNFTCQPTLFNTDDAGPGKMAGGSTARSNNAGSSSPLFKI